MRKLLTGSPNTVLSNLNIFKGMRAVSTENGFFVALAEDEDEVARFGFVNGELDGLLAV